MVLFSATILIAIIFKWQAKLRIRFEMSHSKIRTVARLRVHSVLKSKGCAPNIHLKGCAPNIHLKGCATNIHFNASYSCSEKCVTQKSAGIRRELLLYNTSRKLDKGERPSKFYFEGSGELVEARLQTLLIKCTHDDVTWRAPAVQEVNDWVLFVMQQIITSQCVDQLHVRYGSPSGNELHL